MVKKRCLCCPGMPIYPYAIAMYESTLSTYTYTSAHVLKLENYGGDSHGSWVLLEPEPDVDLQSCAGIKRT